MTTLTDAKFEFILSLLPKALNLEKQEYLRSLINYLFLHTLSDDQKIYGGSALSDMCIKRLKNFTSHLQKANAAVEDIIQNEELNYLELALFQKSGGPWSLTKEQKDEIKANLLASVTYNNELAAASSEILVKLKPKRGRPLDRVGYLTVLHFAAIFEWATKTKATRIVDRITGEETGPFYNFASNMWVLTSKNGTDGFIGAFRNWSDYSKKFKEKSPIVVNFIIKMEQNRQL